MKIKVAEASPRQLDWLVAKCIGGYELAVGPRMLAVYNRFDGSGCPAGYFTPTTDWTQCGALITLEKIGVLPDDGHRGSQWHAFCWAPSQHDLTFEDGQSCNQAGATPQIAICRCFVACRLGEEVEAPAELV